MAEAIEARNHMVESNLRLIDYTLRRLGLSTARDSELWSEGACALIESAGRYDPARGSGFAAFAIPRIRGRALDWLNRRGTITGSANVGRRVCKLRRAARELPANSEATLAKLSRLSGYPLRSVKQLAVFLPRAVSMDSDLALRLEADVPSPRDAGTLDDRLQELETALQQLPHRLRLVVTEAFGLNGGTPRLHREIAADLQLTRQRVDQLQREALACLRRQLEG